MDNHVPIFKHEQMQVHGAEDLLKYGAIFAVIEFLVVRMQLRMKLSTRRPKSLASAPPIKQELPLRRQGYRCAPGAPRRAEVVSAVRAAAPRLLACRPP